MTYKQYKQLKEELRYKDVVFWTAEEYKQEIDLLDQIEKYNKEYKVTAEDLYQLELSINEIHEIQKELTSKIEALRLFQKFFITIIILGIACLI